MKHLRSTIKISAAGQHDMLAHDIATQCAANLLPQLPPAAEAMSVAELRGYLRVRALPIIRAAVCEATTRRQLSSPLAEQLISNTLQRVVHQVVDTLHTPPIVAMPTVHVRQRAA